jgi:hypothetical protein
MKMKLEAMRHAYTTAGATTNALAPNLVPRRQVLRVLAILALLPLISIGLQPVYAGTDTPIASSSITDKTIDRRVRSEDRNYAITFAAEAPDDSSKYGHAFIIWQQEDDAKHMSIADAIGFYPSGDPGTFNVIFGTPGALETDAGSIASRKFTVLLNRDQYLQALERKSAWQQNGRYKFLWNNCVTHVADIAKAIGLDTSSGKWVTPKDYVEDLTNRNRTPDAAPKPTNAGVHPPAAPPGATPSPAPPPKSPSFVSPPPHSSPRRPIGPGIYDRGWGNGAGNGGSSGLGGGGAAPPFRGWFGPR